MAAKTINVQLIRAVRIAGKTITATQGDGKTAKATVITVPVQLGRELIANAKAVETSEKPNATLPKVETSLEDELGE
jgi:hypothetical protein